MAAAKEIAVVNCGIGNLHSVAAAVARVSPQTRVTITDNADDIARADKIILPGDGHFDACMHNIDALGLRGVLIDAARSKPFLGICVGMQALFAGSEEGEAAGLALLDARIIKLKAQRARGEKIPHIGWNTAHHCRAHEWTDGTADGTRFYFVHSYCAPVGEWTLMQTTYGAAFSAVVACGNLWATQFHPEKSGADGIALLARFVCDDAEDKSDGADGDDDNNADDNNEGGSDGEKKA